MRFVPSEGTKKIWAAVAAGCVLLASVLLYAWEGTSYKEGVMLPSDPLEHAKQALPEEISPTEVAAETNKKSMIIDLKGAVGQPGVYELEEGSRIIDVIKMGGGFLEEAEGNALNLAAKLRDGDMIYVPTKEEWENTRSQQRLSMAMNPTNTGTQGLININQADADQLSSLPGIGPTKAQAIIAYREQNGGFNKIEDLTKVQGIGAKTFEKLKDKIFVR